MLFEITYTDPDTQQTKVIEWEFFDTPNALAEVPGQEPYTVNISAEEWAEDLAYSLANKGNYSVKKIKP